MMRSLTTATLLLLGACTQPLPPSDTNPTHSNAPRATPEAKPPVEFIAVVSSENRLITAHVAGPLSRIEITSGSIIQKDQEVALLDDTQLKSKVEAAKAGEKSARAAEGASGARIHSLQMKANSLGHLEKLGLETGIAVATARGELNSTGAEAAAAAAKAGEASVQLAQAQHDLDDAHIKAPMGGIVTNVKVHEGQVVSVGTPIARVFDPSKLTIRFAVDKEYRDQLKEGQQVQFFADGSTKPLSATIRHISQAQEPPINLTVVDADITTNLVPGSLAVATVGKVRLIDTRVADARQTRPTRGAKP